MKAFAKSGRLNEAAGEVETVSGAPRRTTRWLLLAFCIGVQLLK